MGKYAHLTKEQRLAHAAAWLPVQYGKKWNDYHRGMLKAYRNRYGVDERTASDELRGLGVETPKNLGYVKSSKPPKAKKKKKKRDAFYDDWGDEFSQDGTFAFIAGFTSGGAPYGVTWAELGLDQYPWEERVRRYREGDYEMNSHGAEEDWDEEDEAVWAEDYPGDWEEGVPEDWGENLERLLGDSVAVRTPDQLFALCEVTDLRDLVNPTNLMNQTNQTNLSSLPLGEENCFLNVAEGKALFVCPEDLLPSNLKPKREHLHAMIFDVGDVSQMDPQTLLRIAMGLANPPEGYCMLMGPQKMALFYDAAFDEAGKGEQEGEDSGPNPEDLPFP